MKRMTNKASATRLDAEWKRLCLAVARGEQESMKRPVVPPAAVREQALDAWRASLANVLAPRRVTQGFLVLVSIGIVVAPMVLR